jgi:hypothetical protein
MTPKTKASLRAVPLQAVALAALDELRRPDPECPLLFPSANGGYFDLHNFRNRNWKPAQKAAGITPLRRVYDLRHTFATFALRAGISTFDLSRYMGTSLAMIDRHYGHLARDGREHAIRLLDTYRDAEALDVHAVDARWTLSEDIDLSVDNGKAIEQVESESPLTDSNRRPLSMKKGRRSRFGCASPSHGGCCAGGWRAGLISLSPPRGEDKADWSSLRWRISLRAVRRPGGRWRLSERRVRRG